MKIVSSTYATRAMPISNASRDQKKRRLKEGPSSIHNILFYDIHKSTLNLGAAVPFIDFSVIYPSEG